MQWKMREQDEWKTGCWGGMVENRDELREDRKKERVVRMSGAERKATHKSNGGHGESEQI